MKSDHGTYTGFVAHYRRGERPCELCRKAGTEYRNEWMNDPERRKIEQARQRVFSRARTRLAQEFHSEYQALYQERVTSLLTESMTPRQRHNSRQAAQRQAKAALAKKHPEKWDELYAEEKGKEEALA